MVEVGTVVDEVEVEVVEVEVVDVVEVVTVVVVSSTVVVELGVVLDVCSNLSWPVGFLQSTSVGLAMMPKHTLNI